MVNHARRLLADESGVSALEYGLLAALIAVGLIAAWTSIGESVAGFLGFASDTLADAEQTSSLTQR